MDEEKKNAGTETENTDERAAGGIPMSNAELHLERQRMAETLEKMKEGGEDVSQTEKWLELMDNERDNTGAMKRKFFGLEMQALLSRKEMVEEVGELRHKMLGATEPRPIPRLEFDESGNIKIPEGENQSFVFVNMGELDRFNKEGGGHEAGDRALLDAQARIENTTRDILQDAGIEIPLDHFTVYRFSGNEFVVSIQETVDDDIEKEGEEETRELRDIIAETITESGPTVEGVKEAAPLVATTMDLSKSVDLFHDLQAEMEEGKRITDPDVAARELFGLTAAYADHALDVKKFESRVNRILDKIDEADGDLEKVRPFFDNYMKKMFTETKLTDIEKFAGLDRSQIPDMSLEYARRNLGKLSDFENVEADAVKAEADKISARDVIGTRVRDMRIPKLESRPDQRVSGEFAVIPDRANGQVKLDEMMAEYMSASDEEVASGFTEREAAGLDYMIEFARRDQGTGLLERGVHYEALEKDFEDGNDVSMLFVDMGFLKYFDKAGGRDVGNNALKFAADLMERAVDESEIKATVYRYAGDEFTIKIDGGEEEAKVFEDKLSELKQNLVIPQGKLGDEGGYYPTELVFNSGFSDSAAAESVFSDLEAKNAFTENDLADSGYVRNKKAELMTMIADKGIVAEKAVGRFNLLIERMRDQRYETTEERLKEVKSDMPTSTVMPDNQTLVDKMDLDDEMKRFWTQTEQMTTYSGKAIFTEDGGANLLRVWAESGRSIEELQNEIETFVEQGIEEAESAEKSSRGLRDRLIEIHARADYFEKKVDDMQAKLESTEGNTKALEDEVATLRGMLDQAHDEKRHLTEQRKVVEEAE
ncbi:MAG: diguanylate cyclase [Patescibacteria group bacterium]|nr:diguanylate cyclase [Patescibacteria group bacterium]